MAYHSTTFEYSSVHNIGIIDKDEIQLFVFIKVTVQHHDKHLTFCKTFQYVDIDIFIFAIFHISFRHVFITVRFTVLERMDHPFNMMTPGESDGIVSFIGESGCYPGKDGPPVRFEFVVVFRERAPLWVGA